MTTRKQIYKYFGSLPFYKNALTIALPVMAQMLIQNLVSLIDNFMVAGLGDVKMSGVNIAGQILFAFMVLLNTICIAGGIFMTQFSGANDKQGMKQAFCFKTFIGIFFIALYMFVTLVFPRQVLSIMVIGNVQAPAILDEGTKYFRIMAFAGIPMTIATIIASSLREIGKVKIPLVISVIATLVNTFFNWIFIYGNLGAPRLEVRGAAIATIIARTVEMICFIVYVKIKKPPFTINLKDFLNINFKLFREIIKRGWKILVSEMLWAIAETITTALYNGRGGAEVVSGMSSGFAIANLFFIAFSGVMSATSVILGKTLGQGKLEQAKKEKTWLLNGSIIFGIFMTFIGLGTMFLVPIVFKNLSESSQKICSQMVFVMAIYMPVWVYVNVQFAISRSGGDTTMGMWVDGLTNLILVIPGMFIMAKLTSIGPVAMYTIIKSVDFIKIIIAHFWLKKEYWVKNLAKENQINA